MYYNHATFVLDGAIGEFLMTLSFFEAVHNKKTDFKALVITRRNKKLFKSLSQPYPFIEIIEVKNNLKIFKEIFKRKSLIFTAMTFALKDNWKLILYKKLLALISFGKTATYIYEKEIENGNKNRIYYDFTETFYQNLTKLSVFFISESLPSLPPKFKYLKQNKTKEYNYIVLHIFASNAMRSLPDDRWLEIIKFINNKYPDIKIYITGSGENFLAAEKFVINETVINSCSSDSILNLVNLIDNSQLYIGVDTGPTHLASLLQKNTIMIGNNSNPTWLPTYSPNAEILMNLTNCACNGRKDGTCFFVENGTKYYRCMFEIENKTIFTAIEGALKK